MEILNVNGQLTMTSIAIVEYINAERGDSVAQLRHSDFLEKVIAVLSEEMSGKFRSSYFDSMNREKPCYNFPKREACLMAMSYSYDLQAKIFDRWQELEAQKAPTLSLPNFEDPAESARAWAAQYEARKQVEAQLLLAAPAVAYVENFVKCDGLIGIREAAKSLGLQQNAFIQMLIQKSLMFRENGHLQSYQQNIDAGRFVVKVEKDAQGKARSSTKFTAKGIRWAAQKLELDKLFASD